MLNKFKKKLDSYKEKLVRFKNNKPFNLDCESLYDEVAIDCPIDLAQIKNFYDLFLRTGNSEIHPYLEIAQRYTRACMHEKAAPYYFRYLNKVNDKGVYSLYLQSLLLSASATNASLLEAQKKWRELYTRKIKSIYKHKRAQKKPGEKLKIAYVCHFFNNSVGQNCLLPFLKEHDRNKFEVYCYNDGDSVPNAYEYADYWRDIRRLSDKKVAEIIAHDGIDIIQEANGFTMISRFGALAYKPAPIQINWFNHVGTTGLDYVDYVMSDAVSIQDSDLPYLTESAYRHKNFIAAVIFDEKKFSDIIQQTPAVSNGFVTFGFFGGSHKITMPTIEMWAKILLLTPDSKLILKSSVFNEEQYRRVFEKHFSKYGVSGNRLLFDGWSDQITTLKKYNDIDIMLDSTPVNGGSTMFEALLQGVPPVSLMGNRWAARSGPSVLLTLNHPELVAYSTDEYVNIAVHLAKNIEILNNYRKTLRIEMINSSLTNIKQYYQNFETAYLYMWDEYCKGN